MEKQEKNLRFSLYLLVSLKIFTLRFQWISVANEINARKQEKKEPRILKETEAYALSKN